jgi:sulfatase maturation enzyme AslB (radical SAM superfamily)
VSFYDVIDNKVVDYCEIVTCLFEHCNLNCIFCPQDHNSIVGSSRKEILAKAQTISHYINNNTRSVDFSVHIMGGELFSDYWLQKDYLLIYEKFIRLIRKNVKEDKNVIFNFVTNLVFERHHLVRDFLDRNGLKISISYDPHGRFN